MSSIEDKLCERLSDGMFHSGEDIARELNVSRNAIWKAISRLRSYGLDIFSVKGKGYALSSKQELLSQERIRSALEDKLPTDFRLDVFSNIASTNQFLFSLNKYPSMAICLSEHQYSGKGRRGRVWFSPFGKNIYLSIRKRVPLPPVEVSSLSLAIGCAVSTLIDELNIKGVGVKWPNDVRVNHQKVGGILVELVEHSEEQSDLVIGVGLNWEMENDADIDQQWTDLKQHLQIEISREQVVIDLILAIHDAINRFSISGLYSFMKDWKRFDDLYDKEISIFHGKNSISGRCKGVNEKGELLLQTDDALLSLNSGEVSIKK